VFKDSDFSLYFLENLPELADLRKKQKIELNRTSEIIKKSGLHKKGSQ
jgi:hypothetical protein